ncbi:hypothetical protein [Streptomyces sp. SID13726]|uniref:hypothetical protein n=1 Tax=Streptomyces sp. SID13726 TaxID=2706058 RepID=UPI0013B94BCF|nr:hypothetical protein [Streptomyces sp. SID13726]NEA97881.1 hypothetical protein [Streptomyces sp. SID13726]
MTISDWLIDVALLLVVFRQLREERLTLRTVLLPLGLITWAGTTYLHHIPTAGHDPLLIGLFAGIGIAFGLVGGLITRVRFAEGHIRVKATLGAAALWVVSMGFRLGFAVWSSHPSGAAHVARFSVDHQITSEQAWVAALILMAFGEVIVRLGVIVLRGLRIRAQHQGPAPVSATA